MNSGRQAWQVEHTTVPMTPQQYAFAVKALAALIEEWIHKLETMSHNNNDNTGEQQDTQSGQGGNNGAIVD